MLANPTGEIISDSSIFALQCSIIFFGFGLFFHIFVLIKKGANLLKQICFYFNATINKYSSLLQVGSREKQRVRERERERERQRGGRGRHTSNEVLC